MRSSCGKGAENEREKDLCVLSNHFESVSLAVSDVREMNVISVRNPLNEPGEDAAIYIHFLPGEKLRISK